MRRVYAYAAYRVGGGPDAEDVTSEVFERAFRYRSSYRPEQGAPITWLIGIARRVVDDRRLPAVAQQVGDEADGFDMEAEVIDRLTVLDAVAMLSDRDRELVAMRTAAICRRMRSALSWAARGMPPTSPCTALQASPPRARGVRLADERCRPARLRSRGFDPGVSRCRARPFLRWC